MDRETTAKVLGGWAQHVIHSNGCGAVRVIGRFGSRSGLRWNRGDATHCTCGLVEWLDALASVSALATLTCERAEPGESHPSVDAFETLSRALSGAMRGGG